jgi:hypothetical protein
LTLEGSAQTSGENRAARMFSRESGLSMRRRINAFSRLSRGKAGFTPKNNWAAVF